MPSVGSSRISSFGLHHQRPRDGELLLLAAGQIAAAAPEHLLEHREHLEHVVRECRTGPPALLLASPISRFSSHRETRKDLAPLRHVADAELHPLRTAADR